MKLLKTSLLLSLALCAGCTTLEVGDAKLKSVLNKKAIADLEYSSVDTNGVTHSIKMKGYKSDQVEGLSAIAEGFARGAVKAALPVPALPVPLEKIVEEPAP